MSTTEAVILWGLILAAALMIALIYRNIAHTTDELLQGAFFGRAHYEVFSENDLWCWRLRAANGEVVAGAEQGFASRRDVFRAIAAVRRAAQTESIEDV